MREYPIGFRVQRLNHSAITTWILRKAKNGEFISATLLFSIIVLRDAFLIFLHVYLKGFIALINVNYLQLCFFCRFSVKFEDEN